MARCRTQKMGFPTRLEADIAVARIAKNIAGHHRTRHREEPRRSYLCEFCGKWHMSSQQERNRAAS